MADLPTVKPSSGWRMVSMNEPKPKARWITEQVLAMQTFFYQPETTAKVAAIAMDHWFTAFRDIPQAAIEQAIRARMLKPDKSKPKPGEIREDALGFVSTPAKPRKLAPPEVVVTAEVLEARRETLQRLNAEFGDRWVRMADSATQEGEQ